MDGHSLLIFLWLAIAIPIGYFAPTIIAGRQHPNRAGLFVLNLFLGWTLIGWVIALVWAMKSWNRRPCPYCAEAIPTRARICPFCRSDLIAARQQPQISR